VVIGIQMFLLEPDDDLSWTSTKAASYRDLKEYPDVEIACTSRPPFYWSGARNNR
jgi:hypothetical protein